MEVIKKYYQKVISYGLIAFGIIVFALILILKPSRTILKEANDYSQGILTNVDFPFIQQIKTPGEKLSFLEIRFGDDSINQYHYNVSVIHGKEVLFNHAYINETSNIIRAAVEDTKLTPDEPIEIKIDCESSCEDVKFNLHEDSGEEKTLLVLYGFRKMDYGLLWYGLFPIAAGLTLFPLIKRYK